MTEKDLVTIYTKLQISGAGQWVGGHYVALSTLAYLEPLSYYIWAKKQNISDLQLTHDLVTYFKEYPGSLLQKMSVT